MFNIPNKAKKKQKTESSARLVFDDADKDAGSGRQRAEPSRKPPSADASSSSSASAINTTSKIAALHTEALVEDPSIFDYDASYEQQKAREREAQQRRRAAEQGQGARYVDRMKRVAAERELDGMRVREHRLEKELEEEGLKKEDMQQFTTSAYAEQKAAAAMREAVLAEEVKRDAESGGGGSKHQFYQQLLDTALATRGGIVATVHGDTRTVAPKPAPDTASKVTTAAPPAELKAGLNIQRRRAPQPQPSHTSQSLVNEMERQLERREKEAEERKRRKLEWLVKVFARSTTDEEIAEAREQYFKRHPEHRPKT